MEHLLNLSFEGKAAKIQYTVGLKKDTPIRNSSRNKPTESISLLKGNTEVTTDTIRAVTYLDLNVIGTVVADTTPVYIDESGRPVQDFKRVVNSYDTQGNLKDTKPFQPRKPNTNTDIPVQVLKLLPQEEVYRRFLIVNTYNLLHSDGVQYEFLYNIAKKLETNKQVGLLGVGTKGLPLIFQANGRPYRAALVGETKGDKYKLLVVLLGQEIKNITK